MAPVMIRFPEAMIEAIDLERSERLDGPDRSAMVRELVAEALVARVRMRGKR